MDVVKIFRSPVSRHRLAEKCLVGLESIRTHPVRVILDVTDVVDRVGRQADPCIKFMILGEMKVPLGAIDIDRILGFLVDGCFCTHIKYC